ncbi:MAG: hypothetical protein WC989_00235 [Micavibrio sp.]
MKKTELSSTMQLAVTASSLSKRAKETRDKQEKIEKAARRLPLPAHLAVNVK